MSVTAFINNYDPMIQATLLRVHKHLIERKFPYHSMSVIYQPYNKGFHVLFMAEVIPMVTENVKRYLKANGFTYSFTGCQYSRIDNEEEL